MRRVQHRQVARRWTRIVSLVRTEISCALLLRKEERRDMKHNYMSPIKQPASRQNGRTERNSMEIKAQKKETNCVTEKFSG